MAEAKKQIYIKKLNPRAMTLKKSHRCTPCPTPTRTLPETPPIRPFLYCSYIVYILFLYCSYIVDIRTICEQYVNNIKTI